MRNLTVSLFTAGCVMGILVAILTAIVVGFSTPSPGVQDALQQPLPYDGMCDCGCGGKVCWGQFLPPALIIIGGYLVYKGVKDDDEIKE